MSDVSRFIRNLGRTSANRPVPSILGLVLFSVDVVALIGATMAGYWSSAFFQEYFMPERQADISVDYVLMYNRLFCTIGLLMLSLFWNKHLYTARIPWWTQVKHISKIIVFCLITHGFMNFVLKLPEPRSLIAFSWFYGFLFILILRIAVYKNAPKFADWKVPTVVIGDNQTAEDMIYAFHSDFSTGYDVHTVFLRDPIDVAEFDISNLPTGHRHIHICYGQQNHDSYIRANPQNFYTVSLDSYDKDIRDALINTLNQTRANYAIVPSITGTSLYQMQPKYFFGNDVMILESRNPISFSRQFSIRLITKRFMDIVLSGISLTILSPFFLIIAVLLKIEGQGGSPFYGGERIGLGGKMFRCWKFRSMEPNSNHLLDAYLDSDPALRADWEKYRKLQNDPRVTTRTARFIRKASIDELPQLWNVLRGDMSLVGPRPILADETHYFDETLMAEYLSVRPGITGLWQVSGRNNTSFKRRVYWDSWYVRNWSLWGDIVILIKTPIVLLSRKGAS